MQVVIGFGGNLGEVELAFRQAVTRLEQLPGLVVRQRSSLYRTAPVGPRQPEFLNAAVLVEGRTHPRFLLRHCMQLELEAGRNRRQELRWGPRILDLDLLVADRLVCRGRQLELPHPRLADRAFALVPASEVAPQWVHPLSGRSLRDLAAEALDADPHLVAKAGSW